METSEASAAALAGLAVKIDGLDLDPDQQALFDAVLDRAASAGAEVRGYGVVFQVETTFKGSDEELQVTPTMRSLGRALGFNIGMPPNIKE